jgi:hypothetical protein
LIALLAPLPLITEAFAVSSFDVNLDPVGFVAKKVQVSVTVTGNVTCSSITTGELSGRIVQRSSMQEEVAIDFSAFMECVPPSPTIFGFTLLHPQAALFHPGKAQVSVEWAACDEFGNCDTVRDAKTIKLKPFEPFN